MVTNLPMSGGVGVACPHQTDMIVGTVPRVHTIPQCLPPCTMTGRQRQAQHNPHHLAVQEPDLDPILHPGFGSGDTDIDQYDGRKPKAMQAPRNLENLD